MASLDGLSGATALVTGGAGFIGSHLAKALLRAGTSVRVLDDMSNGDARRLPDSIALLVGDVRSDEDLRAALAGVDLVFHHAAQINPLYPIDDPLTDFEVNARGTLQLLHYARKFGIRRVIIASTNLYGDASVSSPFSENTSTLALPRTLLSPYAASKTAAEAYAKVFNDELGLGTVRLRYSNVYGPGQTPRSGSGVVSIFVQCALAGLPLALHGDGEQTRDFVYVDDVVDANLRAVSDPRALGEVFNVAAGKETSIRELANLILQVTGSPSELVTAPARAAAFRRAPLCNSSIRTTLGWEPSTSLRDGLQATVLAARTSGSLRAAP